MPNFVALASTVYEISCHKDGSFPMEKKIYKLGKNWINFAKLMHEFQNRYEKTKIAKLHLNMCLSCIQNFITLASTVYEISCHKDGSFPMEKVSKTTGP